MSYLTPDELAYVDLLGTSRLTPFVIMNVSNTQFSIARHYGGITYQGAGYAHLPDHDELIRRDVLEMVQRYRKEIAKTKRDAEKQIADDAQGDLL